MNLGIVGHEEAKFTLQQRAAVTELITRLIREAPDPLVVSGECPLGGIDIWARELAYVLDVPFIPFPPATNDWEGGFKPRNIQIAEASDIVHCIVVRTLPDSYRGRRFASCYHCHTNDHVKSGGCWTAKYAERIGRQAQWHIID
jgi:hypothetical protein